MMTKLTTPKSILIGFALIALSIASIPYSNLIVPKAHADVAGMDYLDLRNDNDFKKAVKRVVSLSCRVQGGRIYC
jgi:hypothetical protein|tara:strand:- start:162 stop:386 length:225 start_codon:yes stop_codon:yes gene_type:complete